MPQLSIVVLSWNTKDLLEACLYALEAAAGEVSQQVIVVDNASADGSADMVAERFGWAELVRNDTNEGYAIGNNIGAARATGRYLMTLNSDTEVRPGALSKLVDFLEEEPGYGACGPRLDNPDGSVQRACMRFPTLLSHVFFDTVFARWFPHNKTLPHYFMADFDHLDARDVDQPPGAALVLRRDLWEQLGGFDPELWLFFNDVDLCGRIRARGLAIRYVAAARIMHHTGASTSQFPDFGRIWHINRLAYFRKTFGWRGAVVGRVMTFIRGLEEVLRLRRAGVGAEERRWIWKAVKDTWTS